MKSTKATSLHGIPALLWDAATILYKFINFYLYKYHLKGKVLR